MIKQILKSRDGDLSSKRFITLICAMVLCFGFMTNLLFGKPVDPKLIDSLQMIVMSGLAATASEFFSPNAKVAQQ